MIDSYYNLSEMRNVLHDICYVPNGKGGFYCKRSQKKRRKMRKRKGKGRRC